MYDLFSPLLRELEAFFKCPLMPDQNQSCIVKLPSGLEMHLSIDRLGENFFISARLGELPSYGTFRDLIFKTALTDNAQLPHSSGVFGYSEKTNRLILFAKIAMKGISAAKITTVLDPYIKKAQLWKDSLGRSEVPIVEERSDGGIFGLIR